MRLLVKLPFDALSGFTGGVANLTTGFVQVGWSIRSVATGVIIGLNTSQHLKIEQTK